MRTGLLLEPEGSYPELLVVTVRPQDAEAVQVRLSDDAPFLIQIGDRYSSGDDGFGGRPRDTGWDWPPWAVALHKLWHEGAKNNNTSR